MDDFAMIAQGLPGTQETPAPETETGALPLKVIGSEQLMEARRTLSEYKEGKARLEAKIIENEQWYKLRHWEQMRDGDRREIRPASGWLLNVILNKHADATDSYPAPTVLPREEGDKPEAEKLSSILPAILELNDFEETYSAEQLYKLKHGCGVYGVFWDPQLMNGLGDIAVVQADLLNLFWEPGVTDIQRSRNLFHVELWDNETLVEQYPQLEGRVGGTDDEMSHYIHDDNVKTTDKTMVIDWYYKRAAGGRTVLHYCKFACDQVLFATENEPEYRDRGFYDHGLYPFVFDVLFPLTGTPAGFGFIDIGKNAQEYIDRGGQAILENMLANTKPRYFSRIEGAVNEEEYADLTKDIVHVSGSSVGEDSIRPIEGKQLASIYVDVMQHKIEELKEVCGNRDVNTGGHTAGVTAASAVAALQEAGSKLSRDNTRGSYRAYRQVILMMIELVRQFYDAPRQFRILGDNGAYAFTEYDNSAITGEDISAYDISFGRRVPLFDVSVAAQRATAYSKMSQNELALQLYNNGLFNPQMADQALMCVDMMDFDRKTEILQKIAQNGTLLQTVQMLQQQLLGMAAMIDEMRGTDDATAAVMAQFGGQPGAPVPAGGGHAGGGRTENPEEAKVTARAREAAAERSRI